MGFSRFQDGVYPGRVLNTPARVLWVAAVGALSFLLRTMLVSAQIPFAQWCGLAAILVLIALSFQLFLARSFYWGRGIYYIFFLLVACVFYYAYLLFYSLDLDFGSMAYASPVVRYGQETYKNAIIETFDALSWVTVGATVYLLAGGNRVKRHGASRAIDLRVAGIIILVISMPVDLYVTVTRLLVSMAGGYSSVNELATNSLLVFFTYLPLIGCYLLCSSLKGTSASRSVLLIFIVYRCVCMLSGLRSSALIQIILMVVLFYLTIDRLRTADVFKLVASGCVLMAFLVIVRTVRAQGVSLDGLMDSLSSMGNLFVNFLSEFGITIDIACIQIQSTHVDHEIGSIILYTMLSIIPMSATLFPGLEAQTMYSQLDTFRYGSSFIAELNFDLGGYSWIAFLVWGVLLAIVSSKIYDYGKSGQYQKIAVMLPLLIALTFSIRSTMVIVARYFVWALILMTIIYYFSAIRDGDRNAD